MLIVDDHAVVGQGLMSLFAQDESIEVLPLATTGEEALEAARATPPDLVLLDIQLPGLNGLQTLQRLLRLAPEAQIIGVSAVADRLVANQFLAGGGKAYVTKQSGAVELLDACKAVRQGLNYLSQDLKDQNFEAGSRQQAADSPFALLSKRELELTLMIAGGQRAPEIAKALNLEAKTINTYRYRIYEKLNIASDVELTHLALRHKLLEL